MHAREKMEKTKTAKNPENKRIKIENNEIHRSNTLLLNIYLSLFQTFD